MSNKNKCTHLKLCPVRGIGSVDTGKRARNERGPIKERGSSWVFLQALKGTEGSKAKAVQKTVTE